MYTWYELMNYEPGSESNPSGRRGICPEGWHLPSEAEWCQLELFLDATIICDATDLRGTDAGGKMKEAGTAHWWSPNTGATNSSGFTALPGGYWDNVSNAFFGLNSNGRFWTCTQYPYEWGFYSWYRYMIHTSAKAGRGIVPKYDGVYCRCLRD
jgi:uncharacterized protein (TIGR02145 family)